MLDADKKEFGLILNATLKTYRIEPDADVFRVWWGALSPYTIEQVRDGFNRFIGSKEGKFSIFPAHIIEAIGFNEPDGRIGADEAWALYPHDESTSAVITNEMAEAMQSAQSTLNEGDAVGARMAFKDAYNRIVAQNKLRGIKPRWFASLGHSKEGREFALKDAVAKGRLTQDHAMSLLPKQYSNKVVNAVEQVKYLTAKDATYTEEERAKAKEKLAQIRAMLNADN